MPEKHSPSTSRVPAFRVRDVSESIGHVLRLPPELMKLVGFEDHDEIELIAEDGRLTIQRRHFKRVQS